MTFKLKFKSAVKDIDDFELEFKSREDAQSRCTSLYLMETITIEEWKKHTDYLSGVDANGVPYVQDKQKALTTTK